MSFRKNMPENVLVNHTTAAFVDVLDALQGYKSTIVAEAIRGNNYAAITDKKWLLNHLSDYGLYGFPIDMPLAVMQQVLLNVQNLVSIRGSKIGVEMFCSVMSLGEVFMDDSKLYGEPAHILLDSLVQGYVLEDSDGPKLYILEDNDILDPKTKFSIRIESMFFNEPDSIECRTIQKYIRENLVDWIAFSNSTIDIDFAPRTGAYYHKLLNRYFV